MLNLSFFPRINNTKTISVIVNDVTVPPNKKFFFDATNLSKVICKGIEFLPSVMLKDNTGQYSSTDYSIAKLGTITLIYGGSQENEQVLSKYPINGLYRAPGTPGTKTIPRINTLIDWSRSYVQFTDEAAGYGQFKLNFNVFVKP